LNRRGALAAALLACAAAASGDGGRLRVFEPAGDFRVAIFTAPEPLTAGPVDVSVLVQDRATEETILDAEVVVSLAGPGGRVLSAPAVRHARNRLFYASTMEVAPGAWTVSVRVRRGAAAAEARATFDVEKGSARPSRAWPYLSIPPVAIALFAANRRLRHRARATVVLALFGLWSATGCSYLKWRQDRSEGLAELKKQPSLLLEKEVLPEDCFVLVGGPEYPAG
jgi:hypothetical protein